MTETDSTFTQELTHALETAAANTGHDCPPQYCLAWARTGRAYLDFILTGNNADCVRRAQYSARENFGPVILNCNQYEEIIESCLSIQPAAGYQFHTPNGQPYSAHITRSNLLEMLDFLREG